MKKNLVITLLLMVSTITFAQNNKEPYMTQTLSGEVIKNVDVKTSGGNIEVAGGTELKLEMYVTPNNWRNGISNMSKDEIKRKLDELYNIEIENKGGKLVAHAKQKEKNMNGRDGLNISFKIWVPRNVGTELATSGGNIILKNLSGKLDFATSGGNLNLDDLGGTIRGRTSGGNISFKKLTNDIDLRTSGGNITADGSEGEMKLITSGGNVNLSDLKGNVRAVTSGGNVRGNDIKGDVEAHTSGGNVVLTDIKGSLDASTSGGQIRIEIKELGKYVKVSNSGGDIDVEMPAGKGLNLKLHGHKVNAGNLANFTGSKEDDSVRGTVNGGGIDVNLNAGSGRVSLSLK